MRSSIIMSSGKNVEVKDKILSLLKKKGDMAQTEMAEELGFPKTSINYAVLTLQIDNKIELKKMIGKRLKILGLKK